LQAFRSLCNQTRAVITFLTQSKARLRCMLDSARAVPCVPPCVIPFVIFMDRLSRHSLEEEGVWFGNIRSESLLFADDVVPLASSSHDCQCALVWFAAECEVAKMKVSSSKSKAMVLNWKKLGCSHWLRD